MKEFSSHSLSKLENGARLPQFRRVFDGRENFLRACFVILSMAVVGIMERVD